ncbi:deoxyribonuclease IV [Candidatus Babeliales bacterium]|nr:deoxyribonuclease IV [Candidatus Babeliales bacterium]MBP9843564.1 deoxyribonuclease IV [Candidatus Babeliales bacterium]
MKSRFGLHVRLHESLFDAVAKSQRLEQRFFQTVLMLQSRKFLNMTEDDIQRFIQFRRESCDQLFVHGAYWSTVTSIDSRGFYSLRKEIELAEQLEFTHIVIHPGSFAQDLTSCERVDYIIQAVKILLAGSSNIIILLENSPHKDKSFSSSIAEFGELFRKLAGNHRVKMCVDTAHAFVAGYDISTPKKVDEFVKHLVEAVGKENIGLLHCNDTKKQCGSYLDEHAIPGYGNIGMESLYRFVHHPLLSEIPVILEMPAIDESLEYDILQQFIDMEILKS